MGWSWIELGTETENVVEKIANLIPNKTTNRGDKKSVVKYDHHVSFLLRLDDSKEMESLSTLQQLFSKENSFECSFGKAEISSVERIKSKKISCLAIPVGSAQFKNLRVRCVEELRKEGLACFLPYEGGGHLSIVYFETKYEEEIRKRISDPKDELHQLINQLETKHKFSVDKVFFEFNSKNQTLSLNSNATNSTSSSSTTTSTTSNNQSKEEETKV